MSKSTTSRHFSPHAALAALGVRLRRLHLFGPIEEGVTIEQKVLKDTPIQKLYDAFITILAGAHGLVEINTRLRSDPGLQAAIGRTRCAEQSVVQDTLDACTTENVQQMEQALGTIYRQHSPAYRHDYRAAWQVLDVDISGMPGGKKAACGHCHINWRTSAEASSSCHRHALAHREPGSTSPYLGSRRPRHLLPRLHRGRPHGAVRSC